MMKLNDKFVVNGINPSEWSSAVFPQHFTDQILITEDVILCNQTPCSTHLDLLLLLQQWGVFCSHVFHRGDAQARFHHRRHTHVAPGLHLIGLHLPRVPQINQWRVNMMDQTVDGAVGRRLQRVVGAVKPMLQRLGTEG